jgi:hypothetical protein
VAQDLTLFLSLTNLRGIPYSLNGAAPGSVEESALFHGDHIRFATMQPGATSPKQTRNPDEPASLLNGTVRALKVEVPGKDGGWDVLQTAAMATGAFPVFLAPRILKRSRCEYIPAHWESVMSDVKVPTPHFPEDMDDPFETLNVDGGVTNNDPFNFAHDYLLHSDPKPEGGRNPREPERADRAVITVAPFPPIDAFEAKYNAEASSSVFSALPKLFSALIMQSRFFGESLNDIMNGTTFSRFIIAPKDEKLDGGDSRQGTKIPALQCASLGAFGGFFARAFRAHDYALGRRNCQKFLRDSFVLPLKNPLIRDGFEGLPALERVRYVRSAPNDYSGATKPVEQAAAGDDWFPIIPLCTEAVREPVPYPERAKLKQEELDEIVKLIMGRFKQLTSRFIGLVPNLLFRGFLYAGQPIIRWRIKKPLKNALIEELGDDYQP